MNRNALGHSLFRPSFLASEKVSKFHSSQWFAAKKWNSKLNRNGSHWTFRIGDWVDTFLFCRSKVCFLVVIHFHSTVMSSTFYPTRKTLPSTAFTIKWSCMSHLIYSSKGSRETLATFTDLEMSLKWRVTTTESRSKRTKTFTQKPQHLFSISRDVTAVKNNGSFDFSQSNKSVELCQLQSSDNMQLLALSLRLRRFKLIAQFGFSAVREWHSLPQVC